MILIGLYIYIFCGILWMIKMRDIIKTAFDKTNYKAINIAGTDVNIFIITMTPKKTNNSF